MVVGVFHSSLSYCHPLLTGCHKIGVGGVVRTNDRGSVDSNNRLAVERIDKMNRNNRLAAPRRPVAERRGGPERGGLFQES